MSLKEFVQLWGSPLGIVVAVLVFMVGYETWADHRVKDVQARQVELEKDLLTKQFELEKLETLINDYATGVRSFDKLLVGSDSDFVQITDQRIVVSHNGREACRMGLIRNNIEMAELNISSESSEIRVETVIDDNAMIMVSTPYGRKYTDLRLDSRLGHFETPQSE